MRVKATHRPFAPLRHENKLVRFVLITIDFLSTFTGTLTEPVYLTQFAFCCLFLIVCCVYGDRSLLHLLLGVDGKNQAPAHTLYFSARFSGNKLLFRIYC